MSTTSGTRRLPADLPTLAQFIGPGGSTAADRELGLAAALVERLPVVQEALLRGRIDRGKARVFAEYLDPDDGEVTAAQARRLCERFVPLAPELTSKPLSERLLRALQAVDPQLRRRCYERAVQVRGVALYLDPRTGAATWSGNGLPADEAGHDPEGQSVWPRWPVWTIGRGRSPVSVPSGRGWPAARVAAQRRGRRRPRWCRRSSDRYWGRRWMMPSPGCRGTRCTRVSPDGAPVRISRAVGGDRALAEHSPNLPPIYYHEVVLCRDRRTGGLVA